MQGQSDTNKLIILEEGMKYIKEELLDIKDILKSMATQREFQELKNRVAKNEDTLNSIMVKVAGISTAVGIVVSLVTDLITR